MRIQYFSVYNRHGYIGIVGRLVEQSMQKAVEEVQTLPDYTTKGEVIKFLMYMYECKIMYVLTTVGHH